MTRPSSAALFLAIAGCAGGSARDVDRADRAHQPGDASPVLEASAPDEAPTFCLTPDPEPTAGSAWCMTEDACAHVVEVRATQPHWPKGLRCVEHDEVFCFEQISRGEHMHVCRSHAAGCEEHRKRQLRDDRVTAITPTCSEVD